MRAKIRGWIERWRRWFYGVAEELLATVPGPQPPAQEAPDHAEPPVVERLGPGANPADPRLDRLVQFDERSRAYPIRELLVHDRPRSYTWRCDAYLDQGREGACVGFAWAHELAARPAEVAADATVALGIYGTAKTLDPWPGEAYSGTSVLAGIKAVQQLYPGKIGEYRWAFSLEDLLISLGYHGPVVLGLNWYQGMFQPDEKGFLHPAGNVMGGHALLAKGISVRNEYVLLHNSWGDDWGMGGTARISFDDLGRLLAEDGEACIPVIRSKR